MGEDIYSSLTVPLNFFSRMVRQHATLTDLEPRGDTGLSERIDTTRDKLFLRSFLEMFDYVIGYFDIIREKEIQT